MTQGFTQPLPIPLPASKGGTGLVLSSVTPVIQRVSTIVTSLATGTTTIPIDDTIPQITEGFQVMTLSITPKSTANILVIEAIVNVGHPNAASTYMASALFQDATANALAASLTFGSAAAGSSCIPLRYVMTAGTTSATTFRIRIGSDNANTATFNGFLGARKFGGVMASSIVITEYSA